MPSQADDRLASRWFAAFSEFFVTRWEHREAQGMSRRPIGKREVRGCHRRPRALISYLGILRPQHGLLRAPWPRQTSRFRPHESTTKLGLNRVISSDARRGEARAIETATRIARTSTKAGIVMELEPQGTGAVAAARASKATAMGQAMVGSTERVDPNVGQAIRDAVASPDGKTRDGSEANRRGRGIAQAM